MKHARKLASLLLALVMVFALATTAFATDTDAGTITISNPTPGNTYDAYKIFDVTYADTTNDGTNDVFSYTISRTSLFYDAISSSKLFTLEQIGETGVYNVAPDVNMTEGTAASTLAPALKAVVDGFTNEQKTAACAGTVTAPAANQSNLQITGLDHGYYFVTTTTGTLCSLDTTQPDVTITDKNEKPTIEKKVKEGDEYGKTSDGEIGDTVEFKTIIHAKAGASGYVLKDKMAEGLTFTEVIDKKDNIVITVDSNTLEKGVAYTVQCNTNGNTFEITFNDTWLKDNIKSDKNIEVTYTAQINNHAVVAGDGNVNETWLQYGNTNETTHDTTRTYTWEVDIFKYANGSESKPLAGATFKILNKEKNAAAWFDANGKLNGWQPLAEGDNVATGIVTVGADLTTTETGKLEFAGFDAGTYYLVETKAPDGYNKLKEPVTITIESESDSTNGKVRTATVVHAAKLEDDKDNTNAKSYVKVDNKSGSVLPSTGGMGTTIFYVLGSILAVGAIVLLVTKKRMSASDK